MEKIRYADILSLVNPSWSVKEKAKFIHDQICKSSIYDVRVVYSNDYNVLEGIYNKKINVDEYVEPVGVCKQFNEVYLELLKRMGIRANIVSSNSELNPVMPDWKNFALIFYDEDYNAYFTNLSADLQKSKYGFRTSYFGGYDHKFKAVSRDKIVTIKQEELNDIDKNTGYITEDGLYSDYIFDNIANEVKDSNNFKNFLKGNGRLFLEKYMKKTFGQEKNVTDESMDKYVNSLTILELIKIKMELVTKVPRFTDDSGYSELKKFYQIMLNSSFFSKREKNILQSYDMVREENGEVSVISVLQFRLKSTGESLFYIYSDENGKYELASIEEMLQLKKEYREANDKEFEL